MRKKKKLMIAISIVIVILAICFAICVQKKSADKSEEKENLKVENNTLTNNDENTESLPTDKVDEKNNDMTVNVEELLAKDEVASNDELNTKNEQDVSDVSSVQTPEKPQGCQHVYDKNRIEATCTSDGYIEYTCTECNHTYKESIPAGHDYLKYYCGQCGKIDPEMDKIYALSAWLEAYGNLNGSGSIYCYPDENAPLSISSHVGYSTFYIQYYDEATQEQFLVSLYSTETSHVSYAMGETRGAFSINNASFSSDLKITFESFSTPEDTPVDEELFAMECAEKIDGYMLRVQNEILYPKTGLKLRDLGFSCYN